MMIYFINEVILIIILIDFEMLQMKSIVGILLPLPWNQKDGFRIQLRLPTVVDTLQTKK